MVPPPPSCICEILIQIFYRKFCDKIKMRQNSVNNHQSHPKFRFSTKLMQWTSRPHICHFWHQHHFQPKTNLKRHFKKHNGEKSIKCSQCEYVSYAILFENTFDNAQWRKVEQMQPMRLCLFSGRWFDDSFENAQWRKAIQMQPMWLCILSGRRSEETFENTQWRKVKQMQPVWLCIHLCRTFENTSEDTQWTKI